MNVVALGTIEQAIFQYQFGIKFYMTMDQHARPNRTTPLQSVWSMALSAMMVECEQFIYLFTCHIQCYFHGIVLVRSNISNKSPNRW